MAEEKVTDKSRKMHQSVETWSPYGRLAPSLQRRMKAGFRRILRSREAGSLLRFEFDMFMLRAWNVLSIEYRRRVRGLRGRRDLKLNVGCGNDVIEGWVNVDSYAPSLRSKDVLLLDIRDGLPLESGSVRYVYTEHFVEHLDHDEAVPAFFLEVHRILAPGGAVRIIVPHAGKIIAAYLDKSHEARAAAPEHDHAWMDFINFIARGTGHKYLYDGEVLVRDLRRAGFSEAYECVAGQGRFPELLQDNPEAARRTMSLYVEAVK